jgi:thymidylate kinase
VSGPRFISISGIVGSGKSTVARHLLQKLQNTRATAEYVRFQTLPCFTLLRRGGHEAKPRPLPAREQPGGPQGAVRWAGYRRRRLTLTAASSYAARTVLFRLYLLTKPADSVLVVDRYFYDSLAHCHLTSRTERFFLRVLKRLVPDPDVALVLLASPATIAMRRPNYASEYVEQVLRGYGNVANHFLNVSTLSTDSMPGSSGVLDEVVTAFLEHRLLPRQLHDTAR